MSLTPRRAPELAIESWLNTPEPITLAGLRGKVVIIEAFQMLCPGCVSHGLPLLSRVTETFSADDVVTLGIHTVFEHHDVQGRRSALEAFVHEYRLKFPVGIDSPVPAGNVPTTMRAYGLQGTPSTLVIDREGYLVQQAFGQVSDLALGALIGQLLEGARTDVPSPESSDNGCSEGGCTIA